MRNAFDFAPFRRSSVGFDRLFDMLENSPAGTQADNFPPFDLLKLDDHAFRVDLAVAGFKREEIEITAHQNVLIIRGQKAEEEGQGYVHRGIATRAFERRFALADHIQVTSADLSDGMLRVSLVREVPEAMKPRRIAIDGEQQEAIEGEVEREFA